MPCSATARRSCRSRRREDTPGLTNASILYMDGDRAPALPRAGAAVVPAQARRRGGRSVGSSGRDRRARSTASEANGSRRPQRRVLLRHPAAHDHRELRRVGGRGPRHPRSGHLRRTRHRGVHAHRAADRASPTRRAARRPDQRARRGRDHRRGRQHPPPHRRRGADLRVHPARRRLRHHLEADGHHDARALRPSRAGWPRCATTARCCDRSWRSRCGGCRPTRCSAASSRATPSSRASTSRGGGRAHVPGRRQPRPGAVGAPDEFDPGRPVQPHMGFGTGAHICLGIARGPRRARHRDRCAARPLPRSATR